MFSNFAGKVALETDKNQNPKLVRAPVGVAVAKFSRPSGRFPL
jgi:hypothetical protein